MKLRSLTGMLVAAAFAGYSGGASAQRQSEGQTQGSQPHQLYSTAQASGLAQPAPRTVMNVKVEQVAAVAVFAEDDADPTRGAARARDAATEQQPKRTRYWQGVVPTPRVSERDASKLVGKSALSGQGEELGEISALVRSPATNQLHAVVDIGGFLGVGERLVAFPLQQGSIDQQGNLRVSTSPGRLEGMRPYDSPRSEP